MIFKVLIVCVDICATALSVVLSYFLFSEPFNNYSFIVMAVTSIVMVSVFIIRKSYFKRLPLWIEIKETITSIIISFLITYIIVWDLVNNHFTIIISFIILAGMLTYLRHKFKLFLFSKGIGVEKICIIGTCDKAVETLKAFVDEKNIGYTIIGFFSEEVDKRDDFFTYKGISYKVIGNPYDIFSDAVKDHVSIVVVIDKFLNTQDNENLICKLQTTFKNVLIIPDFSKISMLNTELSYLFNDQLFYIKIVNNLYSRSSLMMRKLFNYVLTAVGIVVISPLLVGVALAVKFTSKGPVLFAHTRIGRNGKPFKCLKFRSMHIDSKEKLEEILKTDQYARKEWEKNFKLKNDPRITKIGGFLRKSSLDELPQLFNVLRGEMSLVGPRPVVKEELDRYYKEDASYYIMVEPGITGLWQVSGRSETDYDYRISLDKWYVINWSLWLDIVILFKTIKVVIDRKGAY